MDPAADQVLAVMADERFADLFAEPAPAVAAASADSPAPAARPAPPREGGTADQREPPQNIDLILDIQLDLIMRVGSRMMPLKDILSLSSGTVVELDKSITDPVEILVNNKRIAYGEVVVVEGNYGIRITHIVNRMDRIRSLGE